MLPTIIEKLVVLVIEEDIPQGIQKQEKAGIDNVLQFSERVPIMPTISSRYRVTWFKNS